MGEGERSPQISNYRPRKPMRDEFPELDPTEIAFDRAEGYFFAGQLLEPFSSRRRRAADSLGLRYFKLSGEDWAKFAEDRTYDGIEQDAAILIWICKQSPARLARAMVYRAAAIEEMNDWADGAGIAPGESNHGEAIEVFSQIIVDIINSQVTSAEDAKGGGEESPGKSIPSGRDTRSQQQGRQGETSIFADGVCRSPEDYNTSRRTSDRREGNLPSLATINGD